MITALVWQNAKAFKQHLEDMRIFRQSHQSNLTGGFTPPEDIPTPASIHPRRETGKARGFLSASGNPAIVPIWDIVPPRNSQN